MLKLRISLSLLILSCISAQAQIINPGPDPQAPFQQVKGYLGLTDAQVSQIVLNLNDYGRLVSQRQQRMYQVQSEIQQETAKSPLDPAALGIRYAEIETICRNVKDEAIAAQNRNLTVLTDAQKVKLKVLEDASKLFPIIMEASYAGLLAAPGPYGVSQWFNTAAFISPAVLSGCQQPAMPILVSEPATSQARCESC
jgi:hypothetical protein